MKSAIRWIGDCLLGCRLLVDGPFWVCLAEFSCWVGQFCTLSLRGFSGCVMVVAADSNCFVWSTAIVCFVGLLEVDLQLLCAVILFNFWREVWSVGFLRPACWSFCSWILFRQACWDVSAVDVSLALPDCFAVCPTGFCCWLLFEVLFLLPEAANALGGLPSCLKLVVGTGLRSSPMVLPLLLVGFVGSGCCWVLYDPVFAGLLLLRLLVAALYPPGGFCSLYFHFEFAAFWRCK